MIIDDNGTTTTVVAPEPAEGQTAGQTAPAPIAESDKYKGKSVEDLARMHAEAERKLGEQGGELGATRAKMAELQGQIEYLAQAMLAAQANQQQQVPVQPQPQPETTVSDADWINNPTQAVQKLASKIAEEQTNRLRAEWQQQSAQMQAQNAQTNYFLGMEQAMAKRPDLFQGIENEVQNTIMQGYRSGYVKPDSLRNPQTWYGAATLVRAMKSGWQAPGPQVGTPAPGGEMPMGGRVPGRPTQEQHRIVTADKDLDVDSFEIYLKKKNYFSDEDAAWTRNPNAGGR